MIMVGEEQEKGKIFNIVEIIEFMPHTAVSKTLIKKNTGNVILLALDSGEFLEEKSSPFDAFVQVIDGRAEIIINQESHWLVKGEAIIIPAHSRNSIKANEKFKIVSTVIKSGYEEVS